MVDRLKLEFPTLGRKNDALDFLREFEEEEVRPYGTNHLYTITKEYGEFKSYEEWLVSCEKDSKVPIENWQCYGLPCKTYFLVRESDNRIVGMIDIRLTLNDHYWNDGGNISYCIRRSERRKGYNKVNLYLALKVCHEHGVEAVLLGCKKDNHGFSRTMRALGGRLLREYWSWCDNAMGQIFVINVAEAITKYSDEYKDKIY